jgi:hypothetical protein
MEEEKSLSAGPEDHGVRDEIAIGMKECRSGFKTTYSLY